VKKVLVSLGCLALAGSLATAACDVGSSVDEAIITSVTVRATDVTRGLGCGPRDGQVFKYTVIVRQGGRFVASRVADCFADATFVDPPIVRDTPYTLDVALYDKPAFDRFLPTDGTLAAVAAGSAPAGAFAGLECTVTALYQVQAFASCGSATARPVPAQPDASAGDSGDASSDAGQDAQDATADADDATSDAGDATTD